MVQHCAIDHHLRSEIVERVALDNRDYRPVGSCIYCGSTEDLTDEHIFPRSLWGTAKLPKASCPACRGIASKFELTCARMIFGPFRMVHELPTDHRKRRLTHLALEIERDGVIETREVEIPDYPGVPVVVLSWAAPGILRRRPARSGFEDVKPHSALLELSDRNERLDRLGVRPGDSVYMPWAFDPVPFALSIAKICYALAVGEFGMDRFEPYLPRIIRGDHRHIPYLVGRTLHARTFPGERDHEGFFEILPRGRRNYLCASIQLFRTLLNYRCIKSWLVELNRRSRVSSKSSQPDPSLAAQKLGSQPLNRVTAASVGAGQQLPAAASVPSRARGRGRLPRSWTGMAHRQCRPSEPRPAQGHVSH